MILNKYIDQGQFLGRGRLSDGIDFKQQIRYLLLWPFAVSFRKTALNSDSIWIFFMFYTYGGRVR